MSILTTPDTTPVSEVTVLTPRQRFVRLGLLLLVLILVAVIAHQQFYDADIVVGMPTVSEIRNQLYDETRVESIAAAISLPPPPPTDSAADVLAYEEYVSNSPDMYQRHQAGEDVFTSANVLNQFYEVNPDFDQMMIESHSRADWLHTIEMELVAITMKLDETIGRPVPSERFSEIDPSPVAYVPNVTVYPNVQAVLQFYYGELFSRVDPDNQAAYQAIVGDTIAALVLVGHVSQSDVAASRYVVEEYFKILDTKTDLPTILDEYSSSLIK